MASSFRPATISADTSDVKSQPLFACCKPLMKPFNVQCGPHCSNCLSAQSSTKLAKVSARCSASGKIVSTIGYVWQVHAPAARKDSGSRMFSGSATICQKIGSMAMGFTRRRRCVLKPLSATIGMTSTNQSWWLRNRQPRAQPHPVPRARSLRLFRNCRVSACRSLVSCLESLGALAEGATVPLTPLAPDRAGRPCPGRRRRTG